jgi:mono/diheme cytochrome c family protein
MKSPDRSAHHHLHLTRLVPAAFLATLTATATMAQAPPASPEQVQRGAYLARAGDCIACHTVPKGQPYAGGLPLDTPIGKVYSTNITPDLETGIGRYSTADFVKVMRTGVAKDGHRLYPAMPYTSYAKLTQDDLLALDAYFRQGIKPVRHPNRPTRLKWPLSMRSLMAVWNALYLKQGEYAANPEQNSSWNRGAYLVQGLGHCGGCHTPRGLAGQEKADSERKGKHFLAGAMLDNWEASPLTAKLDTGLQAWSKAEIVEFLKTGRTARMAAFGAMAGVIEKSTQYLTDQDLMAMAEYLKSLPSSDRTRRVETEPAMRASQAFAAQQALRAGDAGLRGAQVYLDNCNACHHSDGTGAPRIFPNLAKNEVVNAKDPISLIHLVLTGSAMPSTQTAPSAIAMPDFGWRLSDEELADVLSFVRGSWGNHAPEVRSDEVGRVRKTLGAQDRK